MTKKHIKIFIFKEETKTCIDLHHESMTFVLFNHTLHISKETIFGLLTREI